jgi:hypothetical protein
MSIADHYVFDVPVSIDQDAYLPVDLARGFRELTREFVGHDLARRNSPLVEFFEAVNLIRL